MLYTNSTRSHTNCMTKAVRQAAVDDLTTHHYSIICQWCLGLKLNIFLPTFQEATITNIKTSGTALET